MRLTLCMPCLFGLEGLLADELRRLQMQNVQADNGRVSFTGNVADIARANIGSRFGERVLIEMGRFPAATFEELYQGTRNCDWAALIPQNGAFPVKGHALSSQLHSVPDVQRIIKKAVADKLGSVYSIERLPESGALYQIQFALRDNSAALYIDTSGLGLSKRGYRPHSGLAPLRETLAAAMVTLARYRGRDMFVDPFCGSGTIAVEAALIARNRAPGLQRNFTAETWDSIPPKLWQDAKNEARAREFKGNYQIFASDLDPKMVTLTKQNARRAGVADDIHAQTANAVAFTPPPGAQRGVIVTNPPYGERLLEQEQAVEIYRNFSKATANLSNWQIYILSAHENFESAFARRADKRRKLYNGMLKCNLHMYKAGNTLQT